MKSMQARYRLRRVAFWLLNGWRKRTMGGLFVLNVPCWVALLCDAMVRAGAAKAPVFKQLQG